MRSLCVIVSCALLVNPSSLLALLGLTAVVEFCCPSNPLRVFMMIMCRQKPFPLETRLRVVNTQRLLKLLVMDVAPCQVHEAAG